MAKKLARTKTTLLEALELARWIDVSMKYVLKSKRYMFRDKSRFSNILFNYAERTASQFCKNQLLGIVAYTSRIKNFQGGNIHVVLIGFGPIFDFFYLPEIKLVGYADKSDIFLNDFMRNILAKPYHGNIHVHPMEMSFAQLTPSRVIQKVQLDHGPSNNILHNLNGQLYKYQSSFNPKGQWSTCYSSDLAKIQAVPA